MESDITNKKDLDRRLASLKARRADLEKQITTNSRETYEVLTNPAPIIKRTVRNLALDSDFRGDLLQLALNGIAGYAGKKIASTPFVMRLISAIKDRFFESSTSTENDPSETGKPEPKGDLVEDLLQLLLKRRQKK